MLMQQEEIVHGHIVCVNTKCIVFVMTIITTIVVGIILMVTQNLWKIWYGNQKVKYIKMRLLKSDLRWPQVGLLQQEQLRK